MPRQSDPADPYDFRYPITDAAREWTARNFREGRRSVYGRPMSSCPGGYYGDDFVYHRNFGKMMRSGASYYDVPFSPIASIDEFSIVSGTWEWSQIGLRCTSSEGCIVTDAQFDFQRKAFAFFTGPAYVDLANWTELLFNYKDEEDYQALRFSGMTQLGDVNAASVPGTVGVQIPFLKIEFVKMAGGTRTVVDTRYFRCYDAFSNLYSKGMLWSTAVHQPNREAWPLGVYGTFTSRGYWRIMGIIDRIYGTFSMGDENAIEHPWHGYHNVLVEDEEFDTHAPGVNIGPEMGDYNSIFFSSPANNVHRALFFSDYFSTGKKIGVRVGGTGVYTPPDNHTNKTIIDPTRTYTERIKGVQWVSMQRGWFSAKEDNTILKPRIRKNPYTMANIASTPQAGVLYGLTGHGPNYDPYLPAEEFGFIDSNNKYVLPNSEADAYQLEILSGVTDHSPVQCPDCSAFNGATFILERPKFSLAGTSGTFLNDSNVPNSAKYFYFHSGANPIPCHSFTKAGTPTVGPGWPALNEHGFAGIAMWFTAFDSAGRGAVRIIFLERLLFHVYGPPSMTYRGTYEQNMKARMTGEDLKPVSDLLAFPGYNPATDSTQYTDNGDYLAHHGLSIEFPISDHSSPDDIYVLPTEPNGRKATGEASFDEQLMLQYFIDASKVWDTTVDEIDRTVVGGFLKMCNFGSMQFRLTPLPAAIDPPDPHPAQDEKHEFP